MWVTCSNHVPHAVSQAPAEAEAQCCSMAKAGLVDVVATEDMDALTFGAPKLVRNMMSQTSGKDDVAAREYDYNKVRGWTLRKVKTSPCICFSHTVA